MKAENKKIIYDILTDKNLSIDEKFFKIAIIHPEVQNFVCTRGFYL